MMNEIIAVKQALESTAPRPILMRRGSDDYNEGATHDLLRIPFYFETDFWSSLV
jgi:hypothetical protein